MNRETGSFPGTNFTNIISGQQGVHSHMLVRKGWGGVHEGRARRVRQLAKYCGYRCMPLYDRRVQLILRDASILPRVILGSIEGSLCTTSGHRDIDRIVFLCSGRVFVLCSCTRFFTVIQYHVDGKGKMMTLLSLLYRFLSSTKNTQEIFSNDEV